MLLVFVEQGRVPPGQQRAGGSGQADVAFKLEATSS